MILAMFWGIIKIGKHAIYDRVPSFYKEEFLPSVELREGGYLQIYQSKMGKSLFTCYLILLGFKLYQLYINISQVGSSLKLYAAFS